MDGVEEESSETNRSPNGVHQVEESVPQDVTREDEKGGSPVDVIRNERSNWEYGPSGGAATRRKRRRTKRYAVRQIDDTKGPEEDGEACPTNQMEDYVVEDDWSLKAVSNCTRKTDNCDTVVKLNLDREPGATVTEIENEDDVVSLPDEDVELIDQLKRLTVGENWSIASGVTSCEEAVESVAIVQQNELAEHCSDKVIAGSSPAAPQPIPEVKEKHVPFVVPETELDGVEIEYNRAIHLHNGTLEVKFEKDKRKDYVHIVAYECSGGQRPERISRHSFRICASSVLSAESSEEDLRNALLDTVKKLEKVSADSLISAEKRPYEISECSLPYLAKRCVRPLKNRSVRFNRSIYYCNACHFHINSVGHAVTHFESKEHQQAEQRKASLRRLRAVPSPSGAHLEKVAELLRDRLEETSLPPNAYGDIELLVEAVNEMLARLVHQDCSVQLYGSYLVQNASPQSNVNLSLTFPGSFTPGQIVTRVTQVLENAHLGRWTVCEMTTDLQCSCPTICFRLKPNENSGVSQLKNVALSVQSTRYFKTSRLVATYGHIRPQFVQISRIFRNWAQTCSLDAIALGGLPKIAFDLMLIHFLQTKRLLPFLFEMKEELPQLETSNETTAIDYEDNEERIMAQIGVDNEEWDMATLWTELFRYYVLDHPTESLVQIRFSGSDKNNPSMVDCAHWNKKRLAVEDPCAPERVMQPSQYFAEFFSSCFLTTFLYFWIPQTASGPLLSYKLHIPNTTVASSKKLRKKRGVEEEGSGDRKGMREPGESAKAICKEEGHFATGSDEENHAERGRFESDACEDFIWDEIHEFGDVAETEEGENETVAANSQVAAKVDASDVDSVSGCCYGRSVMLQLSRKANNHFFSRRGLEELGIYLHRGSIDTESAAPKTFLDALTDAARGTGNDPFKGSAETKESKDSSIELMLEMPEVDVTAVEKEWRNLHREDLFFEWSIKAFANDLEEGENETVAANSQVAAKVDASDVDSVSGCCYGRSVMLQLSRKANNHFFSRRGLEELGIYLHRGSIDTESAAPKTFLDALTDAARGTGNDPFKGSAETKESKDSSIELMLEMPEVDVTAVEKEWRNLHREDLFFEWSIKAFANDLKPQLRCVCCGRGGHLIETCPDLELPPIIPIQPLSNKQKEFLELVILDTYERLRMTPEYGCMMRDLCENLEKCLCDKYRSDCRLALFGSAGNGFGLIGSDADICLRFESETFTEDIDACEVITTVAEVVSTMPGIISVTPVPSAKVPIVKIQCNNRYHRLEADLSLYNVLALENTRLLRAYSELDERATVLGVLVKEWAKCCEIGDASRGSLSSYSFIVMLIHFLQRTTPPVLPFLQEIEGRTCPKEARIVDGCDVYFCTAKDSEWHTKNVENVTELWLGFLDYFSRRFDFTAEVVQIRRKEPLSKLDKRWQGKPIAIEDPFDLKHNLSCGVHLQTMAYIKRSFIQSRERFARIRVPTRQLSNRRFEAFLIELLHDCRVGDGPPLARNCCYRCKQIGHFVENCPVGQKGHKRYNQSSAAMLANRKYLRSGKGTNVEENRERQLRKGSLADDELPSKADSQMSTNRGNGGRGRCRPGHMEHFSEPDRKDDLSPLSPFPVMSFKRGRGRGRREQRTFSENAPAINDVDEVVSVGTSKKKEPKW